MQFHDYSSNYQLFNRAAPKNQRFSGHREFYKWWLEKLALSCWMRHKKMLHEIDPFTPILGQSESRWHDDERPYYNVWPSIIPSLCKLRLDADASHFTLPREHLLLRFPKTDSPLTFDWQGKEWSVRAVLASNAELFSGANEKGGVYYATPEDRPPCVRGIAFWIDIGEPSAFSWGDVFESRGYKANLRTFQMIYKHISCEPGKSIEWSFENIPSHHTAMDGVQIPEALVKDVARIVCTICLMTDSPELVEPIVLADDQRKFDDTGDTRYVDKAKRRGNFGWHIGRNVQYAPHLRSASPAALYWTGPGRTIPRIRFRKGSIVHRKRLGSVPTGYLDREPKRNAE